MKVERSVEIAASPARVWQVLMDVERWPEWTASMERVERLDEGPLARGSRARIKQPRLPTTVWSVTQLDEGSSFTWEAGAFGGKTIAFHEVVAAGGGSRVTLTARTEGGLLGLLSPLLEGMTRRYVGMEAEGLKRRSEEA